jgi:hypothetical protein
MAAICGTIAIFTVTRHADQPHVNMQQLGTSSNSFPNSRHKPQACLQCQLLQAQAARRCGHVACIVGFEDVDDVWRHVPHWPNAGVGERVGPLVAHQRQGPRPVARGTCCTVHQMSLPEAQYLTNTMAALVPVDWHLSA